MHYPSASQAASGIHKPNKDTSAAVGSGLVSPPPEPEGKWDLEAHLRPCLLPSKTSLISTETVTSKKMKLLIQLEESCWFVFFQ